MQNLYPFSFFQNIDYQMAKSILNKNAIVNPNYKSLHNLGLFYVENGVMMKDGKVRKANCLGLRYLDMSRKITETYQNDMALGYVYSEMKQYKMSSNAFNKACIIKPSFASMYNYGIVCLNNRDFAQASFSIKASIEMCPIEMVKDVYISYLYALCFISTSDCLKAMHDLPETIIDGSDVDLIAVAYICGYYEFIIEHVDDVFKKWYLEIPIIAMITDCFLMLNDHNKAEKYINMQLSELKGFDVPMKNEINNTKRVLSDEKYRTHIIGSFFPRIPLYKEDWYFKE